MEPSIKEKAKNALNSGEMAKARELYTEVLQEDSESSDALYALGTIAYTEKDYQTALTHLKKAAELEPEAVDIAFNYASALATVGDRLGALLQLQRATKYCRDDAYFVPRIADMSVRLGEPAAAITLLSRLPQLLPQDQIILANAQGMMGNWRAAVNGLQYLYKSRPDDAVVAEKLALAAGKLRDYNTCISSYERYLQLVKPTSHDYLRFADLLLIAQNAERASQALNIAIEKGEDSASAYLLKARIERLRNDTDAVLLSIDEVLKREEKNGQAWQIKAEMASERQLDEFINELQNQIDDQEGLTKITDWHKALLHYSLAHLHDRIGNYQLAAQALAVANDIQYRGLQLDNSFYSANATQAQTQQLIQTFSADVFDFEGAQIDQDKNAITPIFIVGMPRSGTTLVERILGQNTNVFCAGEQEGMEFVATHFKHQTLIKRFPEVSKITAAVWTELRKMYLEKLPEMSKSIFTDKLPHNFRNVGLILKLFPEARIIQMHRDAKDTCLSIYERAFAAGHNYANRWQDLLHFNSQAELLMKYWSGLNSAQILDVHYENLVGDSEKYVQELVEFVGFRWDPSYLDFHQSSHESFTFSEIQVRQPITASRIGRWKNYRAHIPELQEFD